MLWKIAVAGALDLLGDLGGRPAPEQLHPEQAAGGPVAGEPAWLDAVAAGVVGLVVIGLGAHRDRIEPSGDRFVVAQPGAGRGLLEDFHDLGAEAASELPVPPGGVFPGDPALLVGGGAQRQVRLPQQPVVGDHAIPGRVNVGQPGPHHRVNRDRPSRAPSLAPALTAGSVSGRTPTTTRTRSARRSMVPLCR